MIIVPNDVKCNFCTKQFCCSDCRFKHEEKIHFEEMTSKAEGERIRRTCYICNDLKFPFGVYLQFLTSKMIQHIADNHLPLKCDKCSIVFETTEDFQNAAKCCPPKILSENPHEPSKKENKEAHLQRDEQEVSVLMPLNQKDVDKVLTPLSKINMRWRRKSRDFSKVDGQAMTEEEKRRQTSTPMVGNFLSAKHFTDSASIHLSSINYTSSTSSESGDFSPSLPIVPKEIVVSKTPPSIQKLKPLNRSRSKMSAQATPLQQVMTKSIQRAYQQHGDYRQSPINLQKRRMSFNSTNSSNEGSLMKLKGSAESPLDPYLSPALRGFKNLLPTDEAKPYQMEPVNHSPNDLIDHHVEFEQIRVIISRGTIQSESSIMSNYKSCWSDSGRAESMPVIDFTPKIVGNNLLKKTISFEPPNTIEKTPAFLMPISSEETYQTNEDKDEDDEVDDNDVFYTPCSTPVRPLKAKRSTDVVIPIENDQESENPMDDSKPHNLWNFVSSVMKIAARKSEDIGETLGNSDKIWNFKKPEFVKKATDYFTKRPNNDEDQEQSQKRRRTSSGTDKRVNSQASPVLKRQRIQPRKPINRMRKLS